MKNSQEEIVRKFDLLLPKQSFLKPGVLIETGLFGSTTAIHNALERGDLVYIKQGRHRLIERQSVLEWLMKAVEGGMES